MPTTSENPELGAGAPLLTFEGLVLGYGRHRVAGPLDGTWRGGAIYALTGPNGAGKTTLIRTLLGLKRPLAGRVWSPEGTSRSYVPQVGDLAEGYPVTAGEVVEMGLRRVPRRERHRRTMEALESVHLAHRSRAPFFALSGGQRQRALIARAMVSGAQIVALDEPTAGVDREASEAVWTLLGRIVADRRRLVVVVTHDLLVAPHHADHLLAMEGGELRAGEGALA